VYPPQLDLTPEQELFKKTCRDFLEKEFPVSRVRELFDDVTGFSAELWHHQAELGWFGLLVPDQFGMEGDPGAEVINLALVAGEVGRLVQPGPVLPTNVVADAVRRFGSSEQKAKILSGIIAGDLVATWCVGEPEYLWTDQPPPVSIQSRHGKLVLDGTVPYVQDARSADYLLVTAGWLDAIVEILVPAGTPGVQIEPMQCLDLARRIDAVSFDAVEAPEGALLGLNRNARQDVGRQLDLSVALQNAESVGCLDRVFDFTLQYSKDRVAFGRPIGSFQAIKHRLADLVTVVECCKATSDAAVRAFAEGSDQTSVLVSTAKAYISEHAPSIIQDCVQIHGGIGVTWDHDLHLYLRRVAANAALYGTASSHRERLVRLLTEGRP
jgi:alkylation response protein AidB-like acyl-CoA dehydrogenase